MVPRAWTGEREPNETLGITAPGADELWFQRRTSYGPTHKAPRPQGDEALRATSSVEANLLQPCLSSG